MTTTPNRIELHCIEVHCIEVHCNDSGFHVFDRTASC